MGLSKDEVQQRVSILKRLKDNLLRQREKFQNYLTVLEKEKDSIENGKVEALQVQVEAEEVIVTEIYSFQKVIDPLEEIYRAVTPPGEVDHEIAHLRGSLDTLREKVLENNQRNRTLLSSKMVEVQTEMVKVRKSRRGQSVYGGYANKQTPALVDITT